MITEYKDGTKIAEYGDIAGQDFSVHTVIDRKPHNRFRNVEVELTKRSAGWTCAGSMARWDKGGWSAGYWMNGAHYGVCCSDSEEGERIAKERFAQFTNPPCLMSR